MPFLQALPEGKPCFGILARFEDPTQLLQACEQVRDHGYTRWDAHSPFPVHGLDRAMGLRPSILPWFVLVFGLGGAVSAMALQLWISNFAYPLVISGKPLFDPQTQSWFEVVTGWQNFVPVTFEVGVLGGALAAVFGMFGLNKLPMHYHPLFSSEQFARASDDGFFISIESWDPKFDASGTEKFLNGLGASSVEIVEN